jgi:hypothetical protein
MGGFPGLARRGAAFVRTPHDTIVMSPCGTVAARPRPSPVSHPRRRALRQVARARRANRKEFACMIRLPTLLAATAALLLTAGPSLAVETKPQNAPAAFLGFRFIANATPMEPAEQARLGQIEVSFKSKLQEAGLYSFTPVPGDLKARIAQGQSPGECSGCEIDYGRELKVPTVMWGTVQKTSNLILNLNIYMADVNAKKMTFVKSVDMRGNTDETWQQAVTYMVKRYIVKTPAGEKDKG